MPPPTGRRPFYRSLAPLLIWQQLPRPADWSAVFGRSAPLEVEIEIGSSEYLARNAAARPDVDFVGVDLRWASVKRALRNLAARPADAPANVRLVMEDAKPVLERLFGERSLQRVHVLFPCPWRKDRHVHHRLLQRDFLRLLNQRLADDGEIVCVTDWKPLFEWTLEQVAGTGLIARHQLVEASYGTKYERKWSGHGQRHFHEIFLTKRAGGHVSDAPVPEDATLNPYHLETFEPAAFAPQDLPDGDETVTFKEIVRDTVRGVVMVRTVVVDGPLTQHLWFVVSRGRDGSWWIGPARGCQMVPTHGIQRALDRLREAAAAGN